jgi:hypothetical protein
MGIDLGGNHRVDRRLWVSKDTVMVVRNCGREGYRGAGRGLKDRGDVNSGIECRSWLREGWSQVRSRAVKDPVIMDSSRISYKAELHNMATARGNA